MSEIKYEKSIKVAEPDCWYGRKYINVKMFVLSDERTVRIMFCSIDDFAIYQDVNDWDKETNIEWAKIYFWDNLPNTVSLSWLYEHGYKPF